MKAYIKLNSDNSILYFHLVDDTHSVYGVTEDDIYELDREYDEKAIHPFEYTIKKTDVDNVYRVVKLAESSPLKEEYYSKINLKRKTESEIRQIESWFEKYDMQVKQYERCVRLGITCDLHIDNIVYNSITDLDNQAKVYQERLAEIRKWLYEII